MQKMYYTLESWDKMESITLLVTATSCAKNYTSLPCQVFQLCLSAAKPFLGFFQVCTNFDLLGLGSLKFYTVFDSVSAHYSVFKLYAGDSLLPRPATLSVAQRKVTALQLYGPRNKAMLAIWTVELQLLHNIM